MPKKETYRIEVNCDNCATSQDDMDGPGVKIPKGRVANEFLQYRECKNCGLVGTLRGKYTSGHCMPELKA